MPKTKFLTGVATTLSDGTDTFTPGALERWPDDVPVHYEHRRDLPALGRVVSHWTDDDGRLHVRVALPEPPEDSPIRHAWELAVSGALPGFSISGDPIETDDDGTILDFDAWEVSLVRHPANKAALVKLPDGKALGSRGALSILTQGIERAARDALTLEAQYDSLPDGVRQSETVALRQRAALLTGDLKTLIGDHERQQLRDHLERQKAEVAALQQRAAVAMLEAQTAAGERQRQQREAEMARYVRERVG